MRDLVQVAPHFVQFRDGLRGKLAVYRRAALRPGACVPKGASSKVGPKTQIRVGGLRADRGVLLIEKADRLTLRALAGFAPGGCPFLFKCCRHCVAFLCSGELHLQPAKASRQPVAERGCNGERYLPLPS